MSGRAPQVRVAPGVPFAMRFIAVGLGFFALGYLYTAVTGGEVWDKSAGRALTVGETIRHAAAMALGGLTLWWGGGLLRRWRDRQEDRH